MIRGQYSGVGQSLKMSLLCQTSKKIQHAQELHVLSPVYSISSTLSHARVVSNTKVRQAAL